MIARLLPALLLLTLALPAAAEGRSPRDLSSEKLKAAADSIAGELAGGLRASTGPALTVTLGKFESPAGYELQTRVFTDALLGGMTGTGAFQVWSTGSPALAVSGTLAETAEGWTVSVRVLDLATGKLRIVAQRDIAAPPPGRWRFEPFAGIITHESVIAPLFGTSLLSPTGLWESSLSVWGFSRTGTKEVSDTTIFPAVSVNNLSSESVQHIELRGGRRHAFEPVAPGIVPRIAGGVGLALARVKLSQTTYTIFRGSNPASPIPHQLDSVRYTALGIIHGSAGLDLGSYATLAADIGYSIGGFSVGEDAFPLSGVYLSLTAGVKLP